MARSRTRRSALNDEGTKKQEKGRRNCSSVAVSSYVTNPKPRLRPILSLLSTLAPFYAREYKMKTGEEGKKKEEKEETCSTVAVSS